MYRYWDGQSWSEQLSSDPTSPPPGPAGPPPPPAAAPTQLPGQQPYPQHQQPDPYGQQPQPGAYGGGGGYPGQPAYLAAGDGQGGGGGKRVALIVLAVVVVLALGVGTFFAVSAATDDGDDDKASDNSSQSASESPTDETESPTESPTDEPASPTDEPASPTDAPSTSGFPDDACIGGLPNAGGEVSGDRSISGGDLTLPPVGGFRTLERQIVTTFAFADGVAAVGKQVEPQWIALYAVGGLPKVNGFTDLEASADQVLECMTGSPNFYRGFSGRNDLEREAIQVDGHDAFSITTEIRVDDPEITVEGDHTRVVVVDTGDDEHVGLFVSVVPLGDQKLIGQQDKAAAKLLVDD